jgi:hypothetical protein
MSSSRAWPTFWLLHAIWNLAVARNQDRMVAAIILDQRGRLGLAYAAGGVLCLLSSLDLRAGYLSAPISAAAKLVMFLPILLDALRGRSPGAVPLATATIETALSVVCMYFLWAVDEVLMQSRKKVVAAAAPSPLPKSPAAADEVKPSVRPADSSLPGLAELSALFSTASTKVSGVTDHGKQLQLYG